MSSTVFFTIAFAAICLQMLVGLIQVREIRNTLRGVAGQGVVGIGHNKTMVRPGLIVLLIYDSKRDRVVNAKVMKGYTNFAKFKDDSSYNGMTLEEIRERALEEDAKFFKRRRKRHPYSPDESHTVKGALIQAVEQITYKIQDNDTDAPAAIKVKRKKDPEALEQ